MQIILGQTDIVMLGAMRGAGDVGIYAASNRLAYLVVYVMMASNVIIAPIIARLSAKGENARLQKILTRAVRTSFLIILPFGLILIVAGREILAIFGREFMAAQTALAILAVGRLMDVALGNSALVLSMTGHERIVAITFSLISLMNIGLNALLIPRYGLEGAAIASAISLIAAKLVLSAYAIKKAGLHTTVLGALLSGKSLRVEA
jgi:O-antigen/teichoic acid export membrane protein